MDDTTPTELDANSEDDGTGSSLSGSSQDGLVTEVSAIKEHFPRVGVYLSPANRALLARMLATYELFVGPHARIVTVLPLANRSASYRSALRDVEDALYAVRQVLSAAQDIGRVDEVIDKKLHDAILRLIGVTSELRDSFEGVFADWKHPSRYELVKYVNDLGEGLGAAEILVAANAANAETQRVLKEARDAAGEVGALSLGTHFERYASRESQTADRLRIASLLIVGITTIATAMYLLGFGTASADVAWQELVRISLAIPLVALAGYLGREASRHRRIANWARQREVQLKTLEAYIAPMPEKDRQRLRADLGRRVFGSDLPDLASKEDSPALPAPPATNKQRQAPPSMP